MKPGLFSFLEKISAPLAHPQHQEFLDEHFSIAPQWGTFKKKLKSKTFVEAVKQDTRADDKLKRYSEANGKHLQARGVPTFTIPSMSSTGKYTVKYHPDIDRFTCNCGDWVYKRSHQQRKPNKDCKHITLIKTQLKTSGRSEEDLVKKAALSRAALTLKVKTTVAPE